MPSDWTPEPLLNETHCSAISILSPSSSSRPRSFSACLFLARCSVSVAHTVFIFRRSHPSHLLPFARQRTRTPAHVETPQTKFIHLFYFPNPMSPAPAASVLAQSVCSQRGQLRFNILSQYVLSMKKRKRCEMIE